MLDPKEVAEYEAWKERKLTSSTDLSVSAYNLEQESTALAWEAGWRAHEKDGSPESYARNPYRAKGMMGERPEKKKLS